MSAALALALALAAPPSALPLRLVAEAEDFQVRSGWKVVPYRDNYYASTFAISFLSRMAALGAAEQARAEAALEIEVPRAGEFQVLCRHEQPWGFAVEYTLAVEQGGREVYRETFGRTSDPKIWAFAKGRREPMERFAWGGTDNIVWQHRGSVRLQAGKARLRLLSGPQPEPAARRHVDVIVLTDDLAGLEAQRKATHLELDGWLVQDGDLYGRFTNAASAGGPVVPVVQADAPGQRSPYAVHVRDWPTTRVYRAGRVVTPTAYLLDGPRSRAVREDLLAPLLAAGAPREGLRPGERSGWVSLGGVLDALNDSRWFPRLEAGSADLELELAVPDGRGGLRSVRTLRLSGPPADLAPLTLEVPGNVRDRPVVRTLAETLRDLLAQVQAFPKKGRVPSRFPVHGLLGFSRVLGRDDELGELATRLALALGDDTLTPADGPWTTRLGVPERRTAISPHWAPGQAAARADEALNTGLAGRLAVVSFGDEVRVRPATPPAGGEAAFETAFASFAREQGADAPPRFSLEPGPWRFLSTLFGFERALDPYREATRAVRERLGPEVATGINLSPHPAARVDELRWVRPLRTGALSMGWSEDYLWQVPEFSVQITGYLVSALRCGARPGALPIQMYAMPHSPGNTPRDLRLSYYQAIAHGATRMNFFCATPASVGMTENQVAVDDLPMWRAIHDLVHETGAFEDHVVGARVRPGSAGLLISAVDEVLAEDGGALANEERKAVYLALRHAQVGVELVTEDDVVRGELPGTRILYVVQQHLARRTLPALQRFVEQGGTLVALGGGGFTDEYGQPSPQAQALFGVQEPVVARDPGLPVVLAKQDLPRAKPLDEARVGTARVPALALREGLVLGDATVLGRFASDGAPALVEKRHGQGRALLFGFLPGLAYLRSGLPLRPVDRGSRDDSFAHFLPTGMDAGLRRLLVDDLLPADLLRDVSTSEPLVEATLLELPQPHRLAVPLMSFRGAPLASLRVVVRNAGAARTVKSVEGAALQVARSGEDLVVTLPLGVTDLLLIDF